MTPVRDPRTRWRIGLEVGFAAPTPLRDAAPVGRLSAPPELASVLSDEAGPPVGVAADSGRQEAGAAARRVVIAADHDAADGLALLAAAELVTGVPMTSDARGVRGRTVDAAGRWRRLGEVLRRPPARVLPPQVDPPPGSPTVVLARDVVARRLGTVELVAAAVAAIAPTIRAEAHDRISVAVGAGRPQDGPAAERLGDHSALIRLTGVAGLDAAALGERLRTAPLEPVAWNGRRGRRAAALALRVLSPRLGSPRLVSHLGQVVADGVEELWFAPVTGSGGLALGAVGLAGRTHLVLRAEGGGGPPAALGDLLHAIVELLAEPQASIS